ncbi:unnamed protein product, partial [marine sediment metagenome]
ANPDDAVVMIKLAECTENIEQPLADVIATYLRLDISRVSVSLDDVTCMATVTVAQNDCDAVPITDTIEQLEHAIMDPFNQIHVHMFYNDDIDDIDDQKKKPKSIPRIDEANNSSPALLLQSQKKEMKKIAKD